MTETHLHLTDDEKRVLAAAPKRAIDGDRYFLSPRVMALKSILGRLEPQKPAPPPLPPLQYFATTRYGKAEESAAMTAYHRYANVMVAVLALGLCPSISGRAAQPSDIEIVSGTCAPSSRTAEGPLDADLTKRQSRFYCNSAIITFFDNYKGHVMVEFTQKESHHGPILGFAGKVGDDGIMMSVDHVYLTAGQPTTVSDGWCKFFFKNRHMSGIACGMKVDETGRRTTAIVEFNAAPEQ